MIMRSKQASELTQAKEGDNMRIINAIERAVTSVVIVFVAPFYEMQWYNERVHATIIKAKLDEEER